MSSNRLMMIAIAIGVLAVLLVNVYVYGIRNKYEKDPVVVYRAKSAVPMGKAVNPNDLETISLSRELFSSLASVAVTRDELPLLQKATVVRPINAGDIILIAHFNRTLNEGLRDRIPAGMKAMTIPVSEVTSVGYFVQPGDHVDILGTVLMNEQMVTQPLLENVEVIAVGGEQTPSAEAFYQREGYRTVTLLVSMAQAQKLVFSQTMLKDNMTLVLRNPDQTAPDANIRVNGSDQKQFESVR